MRKSVGIGLAALAAAGASSLALAAIPDSADLIHVCYSQSSSARTGGASLTIIDPAKGGKCGRGQTELAFNQQGPAGVDGLDGLDGERGAPGPAVDPTRVYLVVETVQVAEDRLNAAGAVTATCHPGDTLLSGGFIEGGIRGGRVVASFPAADGFQTNLVTGWNVQWTDGAAGEWFAAEAACLRS